MKKRIIILLTTTIVFCSFLIGCKITKDTTKSKEEVVSVIQEQEEKELEMMEDFLASEEEKEMLKQEIEKNKENNIHSENLSGKYTIVNNDNTATCEINIENVKENISTKGDYSSLWIYSKINNNKYGVFYSFINEEDKDYLIKNIPIVFAKEKVKETTYEEFLYTNGNLALKEVYEITTFDELDIPYYGYAFIYETTTGEDLLCVAINTTPMQKDNIDNVSNHISNIKL